MAPTLSEAQNAIKTLMEKYEKVVKEGKEEEFNEERVKLQFIDDFLEALGWDVRGKEFIDEVKPEQRTLVGPVDFSLRINGKEKIFFEIKSFSEDLSGYRTVRGRKQTFADQAINYAWHRKVDWAVLTNFKETRLYYAHVQKPDEGLLYPPIKYNEYLSRFNDLWLLSKESVASGLLDTKEKRRTRRDIDEEVLKDLFECRKLLTDDIQKRYEGVQTQIFMESVQRILDRLIVIRFTEDKNIEHPDGLWEILDQYNKLVSNKEAIPFMRRLKGWFDYYKEIYDSKIFEEHISDKILISNDVLQDIITRLYKYNFDLIDADVLGNIYEDYLGHVIQGKELVEKREKRKKAGIYYTPTHVVDYIVRNTVGALIEEKKEALKKELFGGKEELSDEENATVGKELLKEIQSIKVLDPACGSGSFLIKAFDVIREYYDKVEELEFKDKTEIEKLAKRFSPEKSILMRNLYGVDLDAEATEIASVNLMLKGLKKDQKLPLILDENIKIGNSLISGTKEELRKYFGDDWEEKKPFNWNEEFKEIFAKGGFDCVIGNPPYVTLALGKKQHFIDKPTLDYYRSIYPISSEYKSNTFSIFIEKSIKLLRDGGYFGFIIPNTLLTNYYFKGIRKILLERCKIKYIINFKKSVFSDAEMGGNIILIFQKEDDKTKIKNNKVNILEIDENIGIAEKLLKPMIRIAQSEFRETPENRFLAEITELKLIIKISKKCEFLSDVLITYQGIITGDNKKFLSNRKVDDRYKKFYVDPILVDIH